MYMVCNCKYYNKVKYIILTFLFKHMFIEIKFSSLFLI